VVSACRVCRAAGRQNLSGIRRRRAEGPYGCEAGAPAACQSAPGLRTDTAKLMISPDGRNAYAAGEESVTAFNVIGESGP
jgi:hypothetical protein